MHPFIAQSIAAERVRDLQKTAQRNREAVLARDRGLRQRRLPRAAGIAKRPRLPLTSEDPGRGRLMVMTNSAPACTCLATAPGQARVRGRGEMPG
jgi:hypothetical protein